MLDLDGARVAVARELDTLLADLEAALPDGWTRPTRCTGWAVRDVAVHLAGVTEAQATGLDRVREGSTEQPSWKRPDLAEASPDLILSELRAGAAHMRSALAALAPADLQRLCPLPVSVLPGVLALQIITFEHGLHANDIAWGLGDERPLSPDIILAAATSFGAALPMLARFSDAHPPDGTAYRLAGATVDVAYAASGGTWHRVEVVDTRQSATFSGSDSAVILFASGRIPTAHASLQVQGDPAVAAMFKVFFPGP